MNVIAGRVVFVLGNSSRYVIFSDQAGFGLVQSARTKSPLAT